MWQRMCANHAVRSYHSRMEKITDNYPLYKRELTKKIIKRLKIGARCAIKIHASTGNYKQLQEDFRIVPIMFTTSMTTVMQPFAKLHKRNINVPPHHQMPQPPLPLSTHLPSHPVIVNSPSQPSTSNVIVNSPSQPSTSKNNAMTVLAASKTFLDVINCHQRSIGSRKLTVQAQ